MTSAVREQLAAALAMPRPAMTDLPPGLEALRARRPERDAAVLVPIVVHPGAPGVLLTRRTERLDDHAGQVCFPGGRIEPGDADAVAAALRETQEEIGLAPGRVEVVGRLGHYRTVSNYVVTPVVGLVEPGYDVVPDGVEVAEIFEVPLAVLCDPARRQRRALDAYGARIEYWAYEHDGHLIWGATAAMLVDLCERLAAVGDLTP